MYLANHTWQELDDYFDKSSLAVIPVGSTEQHGPHLPEGTDHIIAESLAREAAERTGFLCTPTINIGVSPHHKQFSGTMWADPPVFRDYIESVTKNLAYHGIDRVVYVNAHGGNVEHLREVRRRLRDKHDIFAVEWMWDESIRELLDEVFENKGPHGGPKETAMIMHIASELVHEDKLEEARKEGLLEFDFDTGRQHGARTFFDAIDNTKNGVLGDQTEATPKIGERLFENAVEELCSLLEWMDEQQAEDLEEEPHV